MTSYTDLAEVESTLRGWGEPATAGMVARAMGEFATLVDRALLAESLLEQIRQTMIDGGLSLMWRRGDEA